MNVMQSFPVTSMSLQNLLVIIITFFTEGKAAKIPRRSQDCLDKSRKKVIQPLLYIGQSDIHCQLGTRKLQQFGCRLIAVLSSSRYFDELASLALA